MILDFGCGKGQRWNENCGEVIGIDINLGRLRKAGLCHQVVLCDGRLLPFRDAVFSLIISNSVLEHIKNHRRALLEITRVLATRGAVRLSQPVDNDPMFILARHLARKWHGDPIASRFTSGRFLKELPSTLEIATINYIPNAPISGALAFFGRRTPRALEKIDLWYGLACKTTHAFHWQVNLVAVKK